jgi:hypothetical protein
MIQDPAPAIGVNSYFAPTNLPKSDLGVEGYEAMRRAIEYVPAAAAAAGTIPAGENAGALRARSINSYPIATEGLKYYDRATRRWTVAGALARPANGRNTLPRDVMYCAEVGFLRFNTKLVRNLTWMTQLQRIIRVVLINHLSYLDTDVVSGLKIADPTVTEYNANDAYTNDDFNGNRYNVV